MQKPLWFVKLIHFEYWTWWVFYIPVLPYYLWLAFKNRSLTFFTNVNTCFENAGFFETSKSQILSQIAPTYLPKTIFIKANTIFEDVLPQLAKQHIQLPAIAKPDIGERGQNVAVIEDLVALQKYNQLGFAYLVQEQITYTTELALLYYRLPGQVKGTISSITGKEFLAVTGNGHSTIEQLMQQNNRARFQIHRLRSTGLDLKQILAPQQKLVLEPVGNHCRGTLFLNKNRLINNTLTEVFDHICLPINGFHYGRFDLRVASLDDLYQGKNIKIMELNGVNSDAAHIFDPNYKLITAYKDVATHWRILAEISAIQSARGILPVPFKTLWKVVKKHFFSSK
jgi:hypothetical protein